MELILPNNVTEAAFAARFPMARVTQTLTPWEARRLGLDWQVQQEVYLAAFGYVSDKYGPIWIKGAPVIYRPDGSLDISDSDTTDGASVPPKCQSFVGRHDPVILYPSAPHDKLFSHCGLTDQPLDDATMALLAKQGLLEPGQTTRRLTFEQCNDLLCEAMFYCGASKALRSEVYLVLQECGREVWNSHNPPTAYRA
ncbi:MAG: hypothetical protein PHQ12_04690 [Chthoniobacteraceae bacterium]|nr:hypothetical protein [Chthoniobacteraceae bacterium]